MKIFLPLRLVNAKKLASALVLALFLGCQAEQPPAEPPKLLSTQANVSRKPTVEQKSKIAVESPEQFIRRLDISAIIEPVVKDYREKQLQAVRSSISNFRKRMEVYKSKAREFASEATSFWTKIEFVKLKVGELFETKPSDRFGEHIRSLFEKHVVSSSDIEREIKACTTEYVEQFKALQNEMLLKIQADLKDAEFVKIPSLQSLSSPEAFQKAMGEKFQNVTSSFVNATSVGLFRDLVVQDIGSAIAVRLATSIATRLGVSEYLTQSGVASGLANVPIVLVGGIAFDWIFGELMKQLAGYDPEKEITEKVEASLDHLTEKLIGNMHAAGICTTCRHAIQELVGDPNYPEATLKVRLQAILVDLEKNYDLGIGYQMLQFHIWQCRLGNKAITEFFFGDHADKSLMHRAWRIGYRPPPAEIMEPIEEQVRILKQGGGQ